MLAGKQNVCAQISTREGEDQLRAALLLTDDLPLLDRLDWTNSPGTICLKLSILKTEYI